MKYYLIFFVVFLNFLLLSQPVSAQDNSIGDFMNAGNYQKAIDVILMNGNVETLNEDHLENLGYCYVMTREYDKAEATYAKLVASKKLTAENLKNYAEILLINQKFEKAKENFIRCRDLNHSDKQIQLKIASCDSLKLWKNQESRFVIENFAAINTQSDEMCAVSTASDLLFLSNRNAGLSTKDPLGVNISTQFIIQGLNVSDAEVFDSKVNGDMTSRINKSRLAEKYWCTSFSYCKERNQYAFSLKQIHRNLQDFSLGNSLIMFDGPEDGSVNNLVAFKWEGMPVGINVSQPGFAKNGERLYFSSDMPGGFGGMDLYYSDLVLGVWTTPKNLGENVNTPFDELSPVICGDTLLYFSSNGLPGYGNFDVYCSTLDHDLYGKPVNMKTPINSIGDELYFRPNAGKNSLLTSNRSSMGKGGYDIYVARPQTIVDHKEEHFVQPVAKRECNIQNFKLPFILFRMNEVLVDNNYNQSLKALADSLMMFNNLNINIMGYADVLGSPLFNISLSEARAKAVADKLISLGVAKSQINYKGMGVSKVDKIENIRYTVILGALKSSVSPTWFSKMLNHKHEVMVLPNGNYFCYCVGDFDNKQEADNFLKKINTGYFSQAYVGTFYFGRCLPKYSSSINRRVDLKLSKSE